VQRIASELGKDIGGISGDALKVRIGYDWPGNVRKLENVIERAIITSRNGGLVESDFAWLTQRNKSGESWDLPDVPLSECSNASEGTWRKPPLLWGSIAPRYMAS
jgi:transcriptional regulator with PAS, ATPase and Fis domain